LVTVLVLAYAGAIQAETLTLPRSARPGWMAKEGLVMAGSWEPLAFRVRRDGSPGYTPTDHKKIVRFAVNDIHVDLVRLDNYNRGPGYDTCSIERFRVYLARTFTPAQRQQMGLIRKAHNPQVSTPSSRGATAGRLETRVRGVCLGPPANLINVDQALPPGKSHPNAFLRRAWQDFCCRSLADSYLEMSRYARSLRKDVLMECNPGGVPARLRPPVDHGRLLEGGEAIWNEGFMGGLHDEKLQTSIPTYKLARRMDNMVFRYVRTPLEMAESMAFNLDCLGCLCWFEYGKISNYPGAHGKPLRPDTAPFVRFYRMRRALFRDTDVTADVAVLRSFPSQVFGPPELARMTARAVDQLIANRACFQIICDQHLAELDRYRVLVLAGCEAMSEEQAACVRRFVRAGGRLCVVGPLATHDQWMFPREKPLLDDLPGARVMRVTTSQGIVEAIDRALDHEPSLRISIERHAPKSEPGKDPLLGLCVELTERGDQRFVHLVNYRDADPVRHITVWLRVPDGRRVREVVLTGPERGQDLHVTHVREGRFTRFVVPQVKIYSVAVVALQ